MSHKHSCCDCYDGGAAPVYGVPPVGGLGGFGGYPGFGFGGGFGSGGGLWIIVIIAIFFLFFNDRDRRRVDVI
jgi:hypothetical protein